MNDLAIECRALHKHFGDVHAVDGLNLNVPRGAVYGFLGRNGAGKTTTIRMLAGLARPTGGEMRVLGLDPRTDSVAILARTGLVIEKMLIPSMTGNDLVRFNRGFFPRWSDALARRYAEVLELDMNRKFKKLSTGNRTKLCLLLALSQGAELIVLDEPTAGLDPVVTDQLLRVMVEDFANEGRTLLLSSHHLSEVERIAEWVGIVDHGKLLLEGRLDDMRSSFRRVRVVGEALPLAAWPDLVSANRGEGTTEYVVRGNADAFVAHLQSEGATVLDATPLNLSEIFLEVVGRGKTNVPVEVLA
ncbi:MAG TPA: ABC transporter ATP-binding protein [Acidobacteriaceae bacterium]|nr:ABC transporter ATP-binding protein [Acidobacteriaceae bacterium]